MISTVSQICLFNLQKNRGVGKFKMTTSLENRSMPLIDTVQHSATSIHGNTVICVEIIIGNAVYH